MAISVQCGVIGCDRPKAASLEGAVFCREHFIAECYARLDHYDGLRKGTGLRATDTESARRFIHECSRSADEIEHDARDLDNLEKAKLVHIILSASELGRHLRRSPRKAAAIAVRLSSERLGGTWEENTETVLLSQYGASVRCRHSAKPGETLEIVRSDTGEKAQARVAWQRPTGDDEVRIGVEFVACENFWGLDWGVVEESRRDIQT
jgi:hypothetical protein